MSSITSYMTKAGKRYMVQYTKADGRRGKVRGFTNKMAAEAWDQDRGHAQRRGSWTDPARAQVPVAQLWDSWIAMKTLRVAESYRKALESSWKTHVNPRWGDVLLSDIDPGSVQEWVTDLAGRRSATVTERALGVLRGLLDMAVTHRRIPINPAADARGPARPELRQLILTGTQLEALIAACPEDRGVLVRVLGTTGMRWGEAVGLRVRDVNPLRRRITATRSASTVAGAIHSGPTKGRRSRQVAALPEVFEALVPLMAGKRQGDLLWEKRGGGELTTPSRRSWWHSAVDRCAAADPDFPAELTPHDLRHTAASLMIAGGASVMVVQAQLGHKSAKETLDIYSHLFEEDLDPVLDAMEAMMKRAKNEPEKPMKLPDQA